MSSSEYGFANLLPRAIGLGSSLWIIPNGGHVPINQFWLPTIKNYIKEVF